jgi:Mg-chelatase subunit ChlD
LKKRERTKPPRKKKIAGEEQTELEGDPNQAEASQQRDIFGDKNANWWNGGQKVKVGERFEPRRLDTPLDQMMRRVSGRRSRTRTDRKRGRYVQARPTPGKAYDLAFDATLRAAAPFQKERTEQRRRVAFAIRPGDYMRKVRVRRAANLVLFLVDASWSMAVAERMAATKGAILSLLTDAYQRRDRVGLIVFQKDRATLVMSPTSSVYLAQRALAEIPVGGKTPLSAGLQMAYDVLRKEKVLHPDVMPLLIVLTDGAGNVSMGHLPPWEESRQIAQNIAEEHVHSVVINMEHAAFDQGLAQVLADNLDSPCYTITELKAENLYMTVRQEMEKAGTTPRSG